MVYVGKDSDKNCYECGAQMSATCGAGWIILLKSIVIFTTPLKVSLFKVAMRFWQSDTSGTELMAELGKII